MVKFAVKSANELQYIAERMAKFLFPGAFLALNGDLGAGKTTFSQGLAKGLGVEEEISSPTFTIIKQYDELELPLYHMDVYRIDGDVEGMGLEEYFEGDGLCVVEWGELLTELPEDYLHLTIHKVADEEDKREMAFKAHSKLATDWLAKVKATGKFHE